MKASKYITDYQAVVDTDPEKTITLDWETFWDSKEYSLRKMSMEDYIRDPRFMVQGVGIQYGNKPAIWVRGEDRIHKALDRIPLDTMTVVCHNAHFDGLILSEHYGVRPKAFMDTHCMAAMIFGNNLASRSLANLTKKFLPGLVKDRTALYSTDGVRDLSPEVAEELAVYCKMDCYLTHELYKLFLPRLNDTPFNADLIDHIARMFTDPVLRLDHDTLHKLLAVEVREKQEALDACVATSFKQVRSNKQFATLLQALGIEPPVKISPTTHKETHAFAQTDREFMALQSHADPAVAQLVKSRLRIKTSINETRATKYLEVQSRGTWPVHLNVSGALTTHRLSGGSGGGGNPQNLGNKSPLRYAILPPAGYSMFAIDSKAIELRDAMTIAHEREVTIKLRDILYDAYSEFASTIYACDLSAIGGAERKVGKVAMLQLQYGAGWENFQQAAWQRDVILDDEEAIRITGLYRSTFTGITRAWKVCDRIIRELGRGHEEETWFDHLVRPVVNGPLGHPALLLVETGTYITYPNLKREYDEEDKRWSWNYDTFDNKTHRIQRTKLYGSKMFGHICQSIARNVVLEQEVALDTFLRREIHHKCRVVMSVHDEAVCLVPDHADKQAAIGGALEIFNTSPSWWPELPVFGEAAWGATYGDAK